MNKKYYIILGPPGSGKGTQAEVLSKKLGYFYFGTGDLMRKEAENGTDLGKRFQTIWDNNQGELVKEEDVKELVSKTLNDLKQSKGVVFDGYPRSIEQQKDMEGLVDFNDKDWLALYIAVQDKDLIERITTRRICANCGTVFFQPDKRGIKVCDNCGGKLIQRQEDSQKITQKRITVYNDQTKPLIDYYRKKDILVEIDGRPSIEEVSKEIWEKLNEN